MINRDNGADEFFVKEILNIMNSKEHKELFSKTAQAVDFKGFDVDLGLGEEARDREVLKDLYDPTLHSPTDEGAGMNRSETDSVTGRGLDFEMSDYNIPKVTDQQFEVAELASLMEKTNVLLQDPALGSDVATIAAKFQMGGAVSSAEKELLLSEYEKAMRLSASKKTDMNKQSQELPELSDFPVSKTEWDRLSEDKKVFLRGKYGTPPWEKAANVVNYLVVVADYLGDKGFKVSESIADRLIKSVIVESSRKLAGKCCKCKEEDCECEDKGEKKE